LVVVITDSSACDSRRVQPESYRGKAVSYWQQEAISAVPNVRKIIITLIWPCQWKISLILSHSPTRLKFWGSDVVFSPRISGWGPSQQFIHPDGTKSS